jgi:hypothetical protein
MQRLRVPDYHPNGSPRSRCRIIAKPLQGRFTTHHGAPAHLAECMEHAEPLIVPVGDEGN